TTDPNTNNNTSSDTDTLTPMADLSVSKTDGQTTAVPGATVTYTIVVSNSGPSTVSSVTVTDTATPALSGAAFTASTGSYNSSSGAWTGLNLASGETVTLTLSGTVAQATGTLVNTVTVAAPSGTTDPNANNDTSSDTDTLTPTADLTISKTDGQTTAVPGATVTYTIVVSNSGPSTVGSVTVTDTATPALSGAAYTASTGSYNSSSGAWTGLSLATGQSVTLTLSGTVAQATGTLVNTV